MFWQFSSLHMQAQSVNFEIKKKKSEFVHSLKTCLKYIHMPITPGLQESYIQIKVDLKDK